VTRRALLVGSATSGLVGVDTDIELLQGELGRRGFEQVRVLTGSAASRAGILDGLDRLVAETRTGDDVVVAYSGHGARLPLLDPSAQLAAGQSGYLHFVVPTDFAASTPTDFRGLLAGELSRAQWRLTDAARSVTTILDCCHSGTLSRDVDVRPKALSQWQVEQVPAAGVETLLDALRAEPSRPVEANPFAVRVVACAAHETAFEVPAAGGGAVGLLTDRLVAVLREVGDRPVSWRALLARVRAEVARRIPAQRPDVEGPADRVPFSATTRPESFGLPVGRRPDGRVVVPGGLLLGLGVGSTVRLVDEQGSPPAALGEATVTALEAADAILDRPPAAALPDGTSAVPVGSGALDRLVRVDTTEPVAAALRNALAARPGLGVAGAGDPAFATVTETDELLEVVDRAGAPWRQPQPADDAGVSWTVDLLDVLARGDRLRARGRDDGGAGFDSGVRLRAEALTRREWEPLAAAGARVPAGTPVRLTVSNEGASDAYASLLDVGLSGRTALVTTDSPAGRLLRPGESSTVAYPDGLRLTWPADVPAGDERPESLVLLITSEPFDARALTTREPPAPVRGEGPAVRGGVAAVLARDLAPLAEAAPERPGMQVDVAHVDLVVVPDPDAAFAVVERVTPDQAALVPRGVDIPAAVSVRLEQLTVLRNRALRHADVRVDWMVLTRRGDEPVLETRTERFPRIRAGEALPLENLLLFSGPVAGFLDLALWVSRDDRGRAELPDIMTEIIQSQEVRGPLMGMADAFGSDPTMLAIDVVAAAAAIVGVVAGVVRTMGSAHIGLYRTTLLPVERFGVGRRPPAGLHQAQDIQFALEILPA
jgi:hypothetical protein